MVGCAVYERDGIIVIPMIKVSQLMALILEGTRVSPQIW